MVADPEALIMRLSDFRQRSKAKLDLVAMGAVAEPALVAALENRNEAIAWCALKALEEMRSLTAVEPLVRMLEAGRIDLVDIWRALETITGEKLGADVAAWRRYLKSAPTQAAATPARKRSKHEIVSEALAGTGMTLEQTEEGLNVTVDLGSARKQGVNILGAKDPEGVSLLVFYTECGRAVPARFEWALRKNLAIAYGAYGIRKIENELIFVMVQTLVRAFATPSEILSCIRTLAEKGDVLERHLSTEDAF